MPTKENPAGDGAPNGAKGNVQGEYTKQHRAAQQPSGSRFIHRWRSAVLAPGAALTSTQKITLLALAESANSAGGSCYPSSITIAKRAALSDKAVRIALDATKLLGWFTRKQRPIGKGKNWRGFTYEYQLQMPDAPERNSSAIPEGAERHSPPSADGPESDSDGAERHSIGPERRTDDLAFDLALNSEKKKAAAAAEKISQKTAEQERIEQLTATAIDLYNKLLAEPYDLRRTVQSPAQQTLLTMVLPTIQALMRDDVCKCDSEEEFLQRYLELCAGDPFLRGEGEYTSGKCPTSFSYVMQPRRVQEMYERAVGSTSGGKRRREPPKYGSQEWLDEELRSAK